MDCLKCGKEVAERGWSSSGVSLWNCADCGFCWSIGVFSPPSYYSGFTGDHIHYIPEGVLLIAGSEGL